MTAITNAPAVLDNDAHHAASFATYIKGFGHRAFSADDIRDWAEKRQLSGAQIGTLFGQASQAELIHHIGWVRSRVPSNHGRHIRVWEGKRS